MRAMNLMWDQRESSRYVRGLEKEPFMRPH
jgi:hypothetical protein